jgi:hypothetical protein
MNPIGHKDLPFLLNGIDINLIRLFSLDCSNNKHYLAKWLLLFFFKYRSPFEEYGVANYTFISPFLLNLRRINPNKLNINEKSTPIYSDLKYGISISHMSLMTDGGKTFIPVHAIIIKAIPPLTDTFIKSGFVILFSAIKYPKMMMGTIKEIKNELHKLNNGFTTKNKSNDKTPKLIPVK